MIETYQIRKSADLGHSGTFYVHNNNTNRFLLPSGEWIRGYCRDYPASRYKTPREAIGVLKKYVKGLSKENSKVIITYVRTIEPSG